MSTKDILEGISLLLPYYDKPDGYHLYAEHEQISMVATDKSLPEEIVEKLIELGWHQEYSGRNYSEDFAVEHYRSDEGWVAYV